jgi:hypothetical protein
LARAIDLKVGSPTEISGDSNFLIFNKSRYDCINPVGIPASYPICVGGAVMVYLCGDEVGDMPNFSWKN